MKTRLAVLTFDDALRTHATVVMPLLRQHGFGATFYVTEFQGQGDDRFETDKRQYMTWAQIAELDRQGFEIGNHTGTHLGMTGLPPATMAAEINHIERRCRDMGIRPPVTFAYPGGSADARAVEFVRSRGYRLARLTGNRPYFPGRDDPLMVPSYVIKDDSPDCFVRALDEAARAGGVCVLTLHGVPDDNHPWVTLSPARFQAGLEALKAGGWRTVAMRDLVDFCP